MIIQFNDPAGCQSRRSIFVYRIFEGHTVSYLLRIHLHNIKFIFILNLLIMWPVNRVVYFHVSNI